MDIYQILEDNNAYEALKACDGLIMTGPTGTNVNDVAVLLLSAASVAETEVCGRRKRSIAGVQSLPDSYDTSPCIFR